MDNVNDFKKIIKLKCMENGIQMQDLAHKIGLDRSTLSRKMNYVIPFHSHHISAINDILGGIDVEYWSIHFGNVPREWKTFMREHTQEAINIIRESLNLK